MPNIAKVTFLRRGGLFCLQFAIPEMILRQVKKRISAAIECLAADLKQFGGLGLVAVAALNSDG